MRDALSRLIIARHGNTFAPHDVVTRLGVTDAPLVEKGMQQAAALGAWLMRHDTIPDVMITSALQRTREMGRIAAEVMGRDIPQHIDARLNEIDYGVDENQPEAQVIARIGADAIRAWDEEMLLPEGWHADINAIICGWHDMAQAARAATHRTTLVITSNGIARFAPHITGDMEGFRAHYPLKMATGAVSSFVWDESCGRWQCEYWNERPALSADEQRLR